MKRLHTAALAVLALLSGLSAQAQTGDKVYIVLLKEQPAATYRGNTPGYAATQPAPNTKFQSRTPAALAYSGYLRGKQQAVLATISMTPVISQYDTVLNGFTARLSSAQAQQLSNNTNVAGVYEDQLLAPDTITTPRFLGLSIPGGIWSQTDGAARAIKGEDLVHASVDTGVWPESPAFSDRVDTSGIPTLGPGTQVYGPPPASFSGACVAGDGFLASACNNKLIGAKFYSANLMAGRTMHWSGFNSPRDDLPTEGGHGSHTASTVAGNAGVPVPIGNSVWGQAAGMAPRARIASYKVCFTYINLGLPTNRCSSADSMLAIDEAVKDGVDSINFSIGGAVTTTNDVVEQAFYRATLAGVFVATSAGNDGPDNQVAHPSPWVTTVASATHGRLMLSTLTLSTGASYTGASVNDTPLVGRTLVRAEDAGLGTGSATLCFSDAVAAAAAGQVLLDPAKTAGKIVICTRGTNARADKSLAVLQAGGVGMVLVDNNAGLVTESHAVPTIHVTAGDGAAIKSATELGGGALTGTLSAFQYGQQPAPIVATSSSRGPNRADANILKPDLAAPGVDVLASLTPTHTEAERAQISAGTLALGPAWGLRSGTSMASPHVAGVALLLKQAHPGWSPAAIKSALMTTAFDTLNDGQLGVMNGRLPWSQGAGFIDPNKAMDPGLVYDMGKADFVQYQCLTQRALVPAEDCTTYGALDASYNLNLPSITLGAMAGTTIVTRRVTNVGSTSATYFATASVPTLNVVVQPGTLTLSPGETRSFTVTLSTTATTVKQVWNYGSLVWTAGAHVVHSPLTARTTNALVGPADQSATTVSGSRTFTLRSGFSGTVTARKGIQDVVLSPAASLIPQNLGVEAACRAGGTSPSVAVYHFAIPAGTIVARFALRQADVSGAADDNDLAVIPPSGAALTSAGGTSKEQIQLLNPVAGNYKVCVLAYEGTSPMLHRLSSWIVKAGDTVLPGAFNVLLPATVYAGGTATAGFSWSGLQAGRRYLGAAQYTDVLGLDLAATPIAIDTSGLLPEVVTHGTSTKGVVQAD